MNSEKPKKEDTSKQSDASDQKDLEESVYENTVPILTLKDNALKKIRALIRMITIDSP